MMYTIRTHGHLKLNKNWVKFFLSFSERIHRLKTLKKKKKKKKKHTRGRQQRDNIMETAVSYMISRVYQIFLLHFNFVSLQSI